MPFIKGQSGNIEGRPKGSKNKKKLAQKEELEKLFNDQGGFEGMFNDIALIKDPYYRIQAKLKLLEFFTPKLKSVDMNTTINDEREELTPHEVEARLKALQEEMEQFNDD